MEETITKTDIKKTLKTIKKIIIPEEQAQKEWKQYCEILKKRKDKYLMVMKDAMYQMKKGHPLIDIYEVMSKGGLNDNKHPLFAISRADYSKVTFEKQDQCTGTFRKDIWNDKDQVQLPQNIFKHIWSRIEGQDWRIFQKEITTIVPKPPIEILPDGDLSGYYILWQVKDWTALPEKRDPFLLKRISENLFAILGSWDVTDLERAVISGLK